MERHKLVVTRQSNGSEKAKVEWFFQHDCLQRCNFEPRDALKLSHPSRVFREKRQTVQFSFLPPPVFAAAGAVVSWLADGGGRPL